MREWKHRERSILQNVMLGSAEKGMVRLITREIICEEFQRISSQSTNVTDGRTEGQLIMTIPRYATHQMGVVSSKIAIFTAQCTLVHMRGLGIACRPSVRPSVCNVGGL